MSYIKYPWETGEVITAEKLNHMEDGIEAAGGSIVVNVVNNSDTGDQEIHVSKETMKNVFFARTTIMNDFAYIYKRREAETRVTFTDGEEPTIFYWNGTFWTDDAKSEDTGGEQ